MILEELLQKSKTSSCSITNSTFHVASLNLDINSCKNQPKFIPSNLLGNKLLCHFLSTLNFC